MPDAGAQGQRGFSLIEVLAAITILAVGLLPLAAVFASAVQEMGASTPMMVAREKAREAIESVHAARDAGGQASWGTIRNLADGGVFLDGAQPVRDPGPDGLVNTADDGADQLSIDSYTREIDINTLLIDGTAAINPDLRELRVIVRYRVNQSWRTYTVVTYISAFS
jgi:prepilin-type N-terminal cleavage/methylation domain-containing protein